MRNMVCCHVGRPGIIVMARLVVVECKTRLAVEEECSTRRGLLRRK